MKSKTLPRTHHIYICFLLLILPTVFHHAHGQLHRVYHTTAFADGEDDLKSQPIGFDGLISFEKPLGWRADGFGGNFYGTIWIIGNDAALHFGQKILTFDYSRPYKVQSSMTFEFNELMNPHDEKNPLYFGLVLGKEGDSTTYKEGLPDGAYLYLVSTNNEMAFGMMKNGGLEVEHAEKIKQIPDSGVYQMEVEHRDGRMFFSVNGRQARYSPPAIT
ncbi:MAG: hypothetical protein OEX02_17110, partial [Cyclobacteriaceae bacterium]|nr:hypothetical protein [Cyclobacteriaceae bacterium]